MVLWRGRNTSHGQRVQSERSQSGNGGGQLSECQQQGGFSAIERRQVEPVIGDAIAEARK